MSLLKNHWMTVRKLLLLLLVVCISDVMAYASDIIFPESETVIIQGNDVSAELAVREFNEIVAKSTGKKIKVGNYKDGSRHIFIGRSPEVEKRLGKKLLNELQDEESLVISRNNDLFLLGGGALGTLYAVYDFVEDNLGYRWCFERDDGEIIDKKAEIVYSGKETRRKPAFTGYRKDHPNPQETRLFRLRNRDNTVVEHFIKGYRYKFAGRISGHGFHFFLPAEDPKPGYGWRPKEIKGQFKIKLVSM